MERQRKSVRWRRKTAGVSLSLSRSLSPPAVAQAEALTSSDFDNRRCRRLTPLFISLLFLVFVLSPSTLSLFISAKQCQFCRQTVRLCLAE